MPLYAYSRQDRKDESRAPISAAVLANMFELAGLNRLVCMDLHSSQIQGFFRIPVDNLYSIQLFGKKLHELYNFNDHKNNFIIVAPDAGAVKRTLKFARVFGLKTLIMHKQRDYSDGGRITKTIMICDCSSEIKNIKAIICDDMIDSGGTFIKAAEQLEKKGYKSVIGLITHGYFTKDCIEQINKYDFIERMIVSNSIDQTENLERCEKLSIIDVSPQLSAAIQRIHMKGGSLSDLFI
jgi:ribose-phosphate pyrophosphokinase